MKSLRELYKAGKGPSSSHTMGPYKACRIFGTENPGAASFRVILYGSLADTGKGHATDKACEEGFMPKPCEVIFDRRRDVELPHENTLDIIALDENGKEMNRMRAISVGGGAVSFEGREDLEPEDVYEENTFEEISAYCKEKDISLSDYVFEREGDEIKEYLLDIWKIMEESIKCGLEKKGTLPGGLGVERKARYLYKQKHIDESSETRENRIVCAYAFAASEENADHGMIVTAPTCGACAVVPSVLKYMKERKGFSEEEIIRALAAGGIIGNLIKHNASISGAQCGCQAEIGTACSMASAALCELHGMTIDQIEYAAEMALEHHLGLTCDPVGGLVQIPCIERNAVAAMRAINALSLANFLSDTRKIHFDVVVATMYETGKDLSRIYRETAEGGLAKLYKT